MSATQVKITLAAVLTGTLIAAGPAIAHAQSAQNGDPTPTSEAAAAVALINLKSGKVLQAASTANGARVVQQTRITGTSDALIQRWYTVLDGDYYTSENAKSGLNLGIDGGSVLAGAAAITANGSNDANQDWKRDYSVYDGNYFAMVNRKSGLCLGISGASTANGAQAAQFVCDGSANQGWNTLS
ncbi:hypothetical protein M2163_000934 [Streptomyces sp. SAI-135]|jgi:hypothetical protein|uniref:RICIN domain-containing protein n=1 Tax=unclassified Streptomyces TaxID=2593676 RepID=UPI002476765F|nr:MULTISPECIES: RICIN domain-containing protein [unclassified Streptomyces]MDH6522555.1 hypothetical protein [Streptomyces sp. SAI-090]MDH6554178.1 hypothetical protein [Streptomyces sp. SAI-041]MDH6573440.1 hypothetical protein [Streptomyces sp. SAI-117]MDH6613826.1 hypothetical protein [Streptomyces sp. SAI-135]